MSICNGSRRTWSGCVGAWRPLRPGECGVRNARVISRKPHSEFDNGKSPATVSRMSRDYVLQPFRAAVHLQIDYARELNEQQLAAVTAPPGPSLVIAGAGSGKTRTLTYRVAYLLEQGIPPDRIRLLTFTNKAAKEMMRRVADLAGAGIGLAVGRDVSFHRQSHPAPAREPARLSARFHHHGPRGREASDHDVRGGIGD